MAPENKNPKKAAPKPPPPPPEIAALIDSGGLSQQIVAGVQEGLVVYDRELRYRFWNPFMEKIAGQPASEVLGRRAVDIHGFLKEQGIDVLLERALDGHPGTIADTPYSQKRTNWSGFIAGTLTPLRNEKGEVIAVLGVIHDVTRRRRTEEALIAHEHRYRQLFEDNPQPMWVHDVETLAFLAVNEAALRHYGYTRQEFLFMTFNDILAPAEPSGARRPGGELRNGLEDSPVWQHRTKSGQVIEVEINSHVVSFAGRRAVLVVANDVTARRKDLQRLRENELKYRTLIEAADVAIFLADAQTGRILDANRRAETLLGLPRHKIVELYQKDLAPPEMAVARSAALVRTGLPFSKTTPQAYVWQRAGRRIPVDIISSVIDVSGRKVVQSIYRDVTERKRTEEALVWRTRQLEVLARAGRQINAVLEVPVILRALTGAALELVQATGGMAGLVSGGKVIFSEYQSKGKTLPVDYRFDPGQGVAGYVLSSKLSYCSNEPAKDPLVIPDLHRAFNLHNLVNVPILDRQGRLLGCLEIHNTENQRSIEETDLTMLELLAAGAATAIDNARLLALRPALTEPAAHATGVTGMDGKRAATSQPSL